MKIRLIADGSTKWQRMIKRWGIAFLIGDDVLFDTFGDSRVFMGNVKRQGIDLSRVRHIVLSHDDWDHIAGLWEVLDNYKDLKVYVGSHFQEDLKKKIRSFGVTLIETPGVTLIRDGVFTTGELSGSTSRGVLYEQSLVVKEGDRLGLVTGCAHPKLPDILHAVEEHFHQGVDALIGGFHLKDTAPGRIQEIVKGLRKFGVCRVAPLHCTGCMAVKEIGRLYGEKCYHLREGESIEV